MNLPIAYVCADPGIPPDGSKGASVHFRSLAAAFAQLGTQLDVFLARAGDTPAAVASYVSLPRSAYLIGAVVLPAHRGKGLYRALVAARLAHAHSRALPLATSLARAETSAPILTHLGFKTICKIPVFTSE